MAEGNNIFDFNFGIDDKVIDYNVRHPSKQIETSKSVEQANFPQLKDIKEAELAKKHNVTPMKLRYDSLSPKNTLFEQGETTMEASKIQKPVIAPFDQIVNG